MGLVKDALIVLAALLVLRAVLRNKKRCPELFQPFTYLTEKRV
jgi:hypothetical protein